MPVLVPSLPFLWAVPLGMTFFAARVALHVLLAAATWFASTPATP